MKASRVSTVSLFSLITVPLLASPEQETARLLHRMVEEGETPGILYMRGGPSEETLTLKAGVRDVQTGESVESDTVFMLNSVTKFFTALALYQLQERGLLSLDDALSRYYPEQPCGETITLRHLMDHTSGIPNPLPLKWVYLKSEEEKYDEEAALRRILQEHCPSGDPPGKEYRYSNPGYWLAGRVVERVSGLTLEEYVQTHINRPVGNRSHELGFRLPPPETAATGYIRRFSLMDFLLWFMVPSKYTGEALKSWRSFPPLHNYGPGYGGLYGTGPALLRVLSDLLEPRPRLLRPETRDLFLKGNGGSIEPKGKRFHGFRTGTLSGRFYLEKSGGGPGFHSNIRIYPHEGTASLILTNSMIVNETTIHDEHEALDRTQIPSGTGRQDMKETKRGFFSSLWPERPSVPPTVVHDPDLQRTVIDGYSFHTATYGDESLPPLIVVHGGPGVDFHYLLPLKELSDRYRVVFYDQRGTGLSERIERTEYRVEEYVDDLDAMIRTFAGKRPVTLLGHSWGGMLVSAYLARHPRNVEEALIIEPGIMTRETSKIFVDEIKANNSIWGSLKFLPLFFKVLFVPTRDGQERGDYIMTGMMGKSEGPPYQCPGQRLPPRSFQRAGYDSFKKTVLQAMKDPSLFPDRIMDGLKSYDGRVTLLSSQCSFIGYDYQERHHRSLFSEKTKHIRFEGGGHNFITILPERSLALLRTLLGRHARTAP